MDKIYKIPKYNKELYLGGTLMKDLKNFVKPILFLTIGLLLISLVKNIDFIFFIKIILLLKLRYFLNYLKTPMRLKVS